MFFEVNAASELPEDAAVTRLDQWLQEFEDYTAELAAVNKAKPPTGPTS